MNERLAALETALRNAHAAGDTEAARRLAQEIIALRSQEAQAPPAAAPAPAPVAADTAPPAPAGRVTFAGSAPPPSVPDAREQGRQFAAENVGPLGAAAQGFGSMAFGIGTPLTALVEGAAAALPGGRPAMSPSEALEYARGIRDQAYEDHPNAYRAGGVGGIVSGAGMVRAAAKAAPRAVSSVFTLQSGQTARNIARMSAAGAGAASVDALNKEGMDAVPASAAAGAVAGPIAAAVPGAARWVGERTPMSASSTAIKVLSRRLGESADALAERYNAFVQRMGRAPALIELMRREGAENLAEISNSRFVGTGAARVFRNAEETARAARPAELEGLVRAAPGTTPAATSSVAAQDEILGTLQREAADVASRRSVSTETAQIGRRDVRMNQVMGELGTQRVPLTDDMLEVVQHPDVWNSLDGALRRRIAEQIEIGGALGSITIPVATWDAMRQDLASKAGAGAGQVYARLRDKVRDYVSERVPEYGAALQEYGRRSDVAQGTTLGRAALTRNTRELIDMLRGAGGGTPGNPTRPGTRGAVQAGARGGVRLELREALTGGPAKAEAMMKRIAGDANLRLALRETLSPREAEALETLATHYGQRLAIREGVELGRRVLPKGDTEAFRTAVEQANEVGVAAGARATLADMAGDSPGAARGMAEGLADSEGLFQRISAALGGEEAARLRDVGRMTQRGAENLEIAAPAISEARRRSQNAARAIQDIIGLGVVAAGQTSGAMKASVLSSVGQYLRLSRTAATRMAELATDPERAHEVIALMKRRGLRDEQILQIYRDAAVAAGILSPE